MRAIKIDSVNRIITEIEISDIEKLQLKDMQDVVGGYIGTAFYYPNSMSVCYVNDEGLFNNPEHFFLSKYYPQPLAGNAIIIGYTNKSGKSIATKLQLKDVEETTRFLSLVDVRALIRLGLADFNKYFQPLDKNFQPTGERELLQRIDLNAFDVDLNSFSKKTE